MDLVRGEEDATRIPLTVVRAGFCLGSVFLFGGTVAYAQQQAIALKSGESAELQTFIGLSTARRL